MNNAILFLIDFHVCNCIASTVLTIHFVAGGFVIITDGHRYFELYLNTKFITWSQRFTPARGGRDYHSEEKMEIKKEKDHASEYKVKPYSHQSLPHEESPSWLPVLWSQGTLGCGRFLGGRWGAGTSRGQFSSKQTNKLLGQNCICMPNTLQPNEVHLNTEIHYFYMYLRPVDTWTERRKLHTLYVIRWYHV